MRVHERLQDFGGLPVQGFSPLFPADDLPEDLPEPDTVAWRISTHYEGPTWTEVFEDFLAEVDTARVTTLIVGYWHRWGVDEEDVRPVDRLVEAADRFPALRSLFVGDVVSDESEISWLEHRDLTGLLTAFPDLERLEVRGGGMSLEPVRHANLRELRFESGGLPGGVVRAVAASDLPGLEHLELWLGVPTYGGDTTVADLAPILTGERLPSLWYLGLCNSEIQDEIAEAVAGAPIVARLTELDLSRGTLTDRGAEALLSGQPLTHLEVLDLDHNFVTDAMAERLADALPAVEIHDEPCEPHEFDGRTFHYVAVSE